MVASSRLTAGRSFWLSIFTMMFLSIAVSRAYACFAPPEHMYLPHQETINDAEWIVRVVPRSIDRSGEQPVYTLEVLERIKGESPDIIKIEGAGPNGRGLWASYSASGDEPHPNDANYYGHQASSFWVNGGRAWNAPDCEIHPAFLLSGAEYLIFGPKDYNVGFENITSTNDLWLSYVRDVVAGSAPDNPVDLEAESYLKRAEAVILIEQKWSSGGPVTNIEVLKGDEREYLYMLHVAPHDEAMSVLRPECKEKMPYLRNRSDIRRRLVVFEFLPTEEIRLSEGYYCVGADLEGSAGVEGFGLFSKNGRMVFEITDDRVVPELFRHGERALLGDVSIGDVKRYLSSN